MANYQNRAIMRKMELKISYYKGIPYVIHFFVNLYKNLLILNKIGQIGQILKIHLANLAKS